MRQFFKDLAALVHKWRANEESSDRYIAIKNSQDKVLDLQERTASTYGVLVGEAKAQTAALERIATALEKKRKRTSK